MKRIWHHPEEPKTGKRFWRSLSQLAKTPSSKEWLDREFPAGAAEMKDEADAETSRRSFLKLMGASTAMAGMAACRRPELHITPYAKAPEWVIPGKVLFYATSMPRPGGGTAMVVHTHEGRPTHLQGNKLHPESNGSLDSQAQASILNLYDPDRAKEILNFGKPASRDDFFGFLEKKKAEWAAAEGANLAILTDETVAPTRERLLGEIVKKFPKAKVYQHEAFGSGNSRAALAAAHGPGTVAHYHFDKADRIFSLDCDFLGLDRLGNLSVGQFMSRRKADSPDDGASMNRLYVVEGRYTLTGGMADHRLRVPSSQTLKVAVDLAKAIAAATSQSALATAASAVKLSGEFRGRDDYAAWIKCAADDLVAAKGKALVMAGSAHEPALHALTALINDALGAFGTIIELKQGSVPAAAGGAAELAAAATAKQIDTLIVIGETDPVFEGSSAKLGDALKNIPNVIAHTLRHRTATARAASWIVPATHYLEQWGDTRGFDGTYSVAQPMIAPLYAAAISDTQLLLSLVTNESLTAPTAPAAAPAPGAPEDPGPEAKAVRNTFNALVKGADDNAWTNALRDGFAAASAYPAAPAFNAAAAAQLAGTATDTALAQGEYEVVFVPCAKIHDGRYINNGWLQEAPDPISKVTWDNAAIVSVKTAKELGINLFNEDAADVIEVEVNGLKRWFPVITVPGHADNSILLTAGYGQNDPGQVGNGTGFDVYPLRTAATPYFAVGAKVAKLKAAVTGDAIAAIAGRTEIPAVYPLGTTSEHHSMYGRALVREGTVDDWKSHADFVLDQGTDGHLHGNREEKFAENAYSFYKPEGAKDSDGNRIPHLSDPTHQWGMVIDLNKCTGCTSCLVACQSENNIPIVGKDQVRRGREMHWIRMDRYFATDLDSDAALNNRRVERNPFDSQDNSWNEDEMDDPEMLVQPVACQHCESAPCETVCPVNATVHSEDGLNVMVYNRCIGTRYCANNCPFKARRFNFFDYNKRNPLVTRKVGSFEFNNLYAGPAGERHDSELSKAQKNPNVSVRMRGVIEKCTYCLQRIESARIDTRANARKAKSRATGATDDKLVIEEKDLMIATDRVRTACQEACPAEAIAFGNLMDDKSSVVAWKNNSRNYELLGYLSVRARTTYLARIKNPNPALVAASPREQRKVGQGSKTRHIHVDHGTPGAAH
jgi:molybdopterin-containing oxidoreductase family iron-sulfur binding subunit